MTAFPTREAVANTSINTVIYNGTESFSPGTVFPVLVEVESTTSDFYADFSEASPPESIDQFYSSMGHLLDIFVYTDYAGLELWIDESSNDGLFRRSAAFLITPGIPQPVRGFRVMGSYASVSIANDGLALAIAEFIVRVRSL